MIELSEEIKRVCKMFEKSGNPVLEGFAYQIFSFKPDKKYTHPNRLTFVCHNAWEMDRLSWQKCKKTITLEETDTAKILKTYYEFPKQDVVNDITLILGKNKKGSDCGWLNVKRDKRSNDYSFSISKKGTIEKFQEMKKVENKIPKQTEPQKV